MHQILLLLTCLSIVGSSYAQDSVRVSYSQEADTLVKQHFIDRYDHVFMTKVPTRQMLKVGYSGYQGTGFRIGYEFKILPSLSFEAAVYTVTDQDNFNLIYSRSFLDLWASATARWYYNMRKRVDKDLSANNFSGTYIGVSYEQSVHEANIPRWEVKSPGRIGLSYGFQSRFLNRGYVDLSIGLFNKGYLRNRFFPEVYNYKGFLNPEDFVLTTQSSFGIALGDWKKSKQSPACDVLLCDEQISDQWKLQLPDITVGLRLQTGNTGIAYERRLGHSPFSVEANVSAWLARNATPYHSRISYQVSSGAQLRYYYLQKMQVRKGMGGSNFSGPYAGIGGSYMFVGNKLKVDVSDRFEEHIWYKTAALSLGYQQRLFKSLYIDASVYYSRLMGDYAKYYVLDKKLSAKVAFGFTF